jgi:hypothetical protein
VTRVSDRYDQGKAALDALELLHAVLQWPKAVIRAEEPAGSGFIDYAIGSPATQLIIEAKREGAYFDLPVGTWTWSEASRRLSSDIRQIGRRTDRATWDYTD